MPSIFLSRMQELLVNILASGQYVPSSDWKGNSSVLDLQTLRYALPSREVLPSLTPKVTAVSREISTGTVVANVFLCTNRETEAG